MRHLQQVCGYSAANVKADSIGVHLTGHARLYDLLQNELGSRFVLDEWARREKTQVRAFLRGHSLHVLPEQRTVVHGRVAVARPAVQEARHDEGGGRRSGHANLAGPVLPRHRPRAPSCKGGVGGVLAGGRLDWVALRSPRLVNKAATGRYRLEVAPLPKARSITYPDLATALLDSLEREDLHRRAAFVANWRVPSPVSCHRHHRPTESDAETLGINVRQSDRLDLLLADWIIPVSRSPRGTAGGWAAPSQLRVDDHLLGRLQRALRVGGRVRRCKR